MARRSKQQTPPPALHELEADVMEEVWARGEASVRDVMEALNARTPGKDRAYTTFLTTMARLDAKGVLRRRRDGKTDRYEPVFSRDEYRSLRAGAGVEALVSEYGDVALSHFAREMAQLDPARVRELERIARGG
jgi:predicted transcriptional regulator